MENNTKPNRRSYKQLEMELIIAVGVNFAMFVLFLVVSGFGIGWLKVILGLLTMLVSAAGDAFLVLINEHGKRRSLWILLAFGAIGICTLVSLVCGYPAPALVTTP